MLLTLNPQIVDSQVSRLLSLAPELIEAISKELDFQSTRQLRLTCKPLAGLLNNAVLRTISIEINRNNLEQSLSKLADLSTAKHAACTGTRKLIIDSLSPAYDPKYQGPVWIYADGEWKSETPPPDPPEVVIAEREVGIYLYNALTSLKGIQSVDWVPRAKDSEQTHRLVMNALQTFPNLRRLRVNLYHCKVPLELDLLTGLQDIFVDETSAVCQEATIENLARLVSRNVNLTSINMSGHSSWGYRRPSDGSHSLHQLFKYYPSPSSAPPLRLRHLGLKFYLIRLDEITLPHLKNLTSLNITSIEEPHARRGCRNSVSKNEEGSLSMAQQKKINGSSLEEIWKTLHTSGIRLDAIVLDAITHSFIDYLSSYTGLRKLELTPGGFSDGASSDRMAERFFAEAFDQHAQFLEHLQIVALYEGLWCFGSHNLGSISKCINMRTLRLGIISSHLGQQDDVVGQFGSTPDVLKLLIDTAVLYMPNIESVHVSGANREQLRWARCGNPAMSHFAHVSEKMERSVIEYRAPASSKVLPSLRTTCSGPGRVFVGSHTLADHNSGNTSGNETLRYIDKAPQNEVLV